MAANEAHPQRQRWGSPATEQRPTERPPTGPATHLRRALALWGVAAYLDLLFVTRGPKQALGYAVTDATLSLAAASGTLLLAERFAGIGTWTRHQVIFMLGYAVLAAGTLSVLFGYNVLFISRRLGRGQFDHTLLQPQPLWLALLTEGFTPFSGAAELLSGLGLLLWALQRLEVAVTPSWIALLLLNLSASAVVVWSFSYVWGSLAFWAPRAAEEISSSAMRMMSQLRSFPLDGAGGLLTGGLLSALPAGFVAWYPCRALLAIDAAPYAVFVTPLAAAVALTAALGVFGLGRAQYARTGSQRYSSFGHRR